MATDLDLIDLSTNSDLGLRDGEMVDANVLGGAIR